jgi:hypothetical protein
MVRSIDQAAAEATQLSDDELYRRIGVVASAAQSESVGSYVAKEAQVLKPVPKLIRERGQEADLLDLGRRFAAKVSNEARDLICGSGEDYREEREDFKNALGGGIDKVAAAVAGFLVATGVGLPAAAVTWLAALIAKVLVNATGDTVCDVWKAPATVA